MASILQATRRIAAVTILFLCMSTMAHAQLPLTSKSETSKAAQVALPDPLTREAVRDLLSTLDDGQVRKLLLDRLAAQADARAAALAARDERALLHILEGYAVDLDRTFRDVLRKATVLPTSIAKVFDTFDQRRGNVSYVNLAIGLVSSLFAGLFAVWLTRRASARAEQRILDGNPSNLWQKLGFVTARLALQIAHVIMFVLVGYLVCVAMTPANSPDRFTIMIVLRMIGWISLVVALARFMLAPTRPALRLCLIDDKTASFLTWRAGVVAAIASIGFGFLAWMFQFGVTFGDTRFGFWVNLALHIVIIATIWQARHGISAMLREGDEHGRGLNEVLANFWPGISIGLVLAHWLIVEIVVATGNATPAILPVMMITLAVLICLPMLDHALQSLILNVAPIDKKQNVPLQAAHRETQKGLVRVGRVLLGLALIVGLLRIWGIDLFTLAEQGVGARFAASSIDVAIIMLLGYALWEFVTIVTQRQIATERALLGLDDGAAEMAEGEGGKGETRLATILPLLRLAARIAIVALGALAIVSELGVNITPLLAGAGIIGLAIGFGAQTLVKDIISGLFFLIDDAFRKGEYIDIGDVKGTVEKISVRSMQLRHHNGPLNTVPFGEINFITNFSRDWVVMKLPFRLTYDTDAEAVRKMIKKLGQEMMEDPVLGPMFLQPLKSQGVIQMEDSAMIMRVKFMTRPGDQWVIRRIVFARIRELFEEKGIKFAHREVTVRLSDQDAANMTDKEKSEAMTAGATAALNDVPAR